MANVRTALFRDVGDPVSASHIGNKVTVVGVGAVGMACAFSILTQKISNEIAIVDVMEDKLKGELMDLQHGSYFLRGLQLQASTDYSITRNSKVCIITAGVRQVGGETRLDICKRNADVLKHIVPQLTKYCPNCVIIVVTNPVDVLSHYVWKLSKFSASKVIGSGTNLDSSRLRFMLSEHLDVSAESTHGWIIGEHGESNVIVWSGVNVAGVRLTEIDPTFGTDNEDPFYKNIHKFVTKSGAEVRNLKGCTSWAIGLSVAQITESILKNTKRVLGVSTLVRGLHGITEDVYLSLPCVIGENGVVSIIKQVLLPKELEDLKKSAEIISSVTKGLDM